MSEAQGAAEEICAREPIHIPGHIQPYGALLVLDPETLAVLQSSANAAGFLGVDPADPATLSTLACLSGVSLTERLREWIAGPEPVCREVVFTFRNLDRGVFEARNRNYFVKRGVGKIR